MKVIVTDFEERDKFLYDMQEVEAESIVGQSRWNTFFTKVVKDDDGFFWRVNWSQGSTECQDNDEEVTVIQVEPVQVTVTQYEEV